jgi:hypothetical protein
MRLPDGVRVVAVLEAPIVEPPLRVDSTAPRMGLRWLAREARPSLQLQRTPATQTSFVPRPPLIHGAVRPIRISCRNQWPPEPQLIEIAPILVNVSGKPQNMRGHDLLIERLIAKAVTWVRSRPLFLPFRAL